MLSRILGLGLLVVMILACSNANKNSESEAAATASVGPVVTSDPDLDFIKLPAGFAITTYARDVNNARGMAIGDNGTIFVGTRSKGKVYALVDENNDNKADKQYEIADGLFMPSGIAFRNGNLYVAEVDKIWRYPNIEVNLANPPQPELITDKLPNDGHHGWKYLGFGPDGKIYFPVGAPCNVCDEENEIYASMSRINEDGTGLEVIASGVRNSVGFDWHPETNELWFTENGRDWLGDDLPPDELNRLEKPGQHFGFPYCHGGTILDEEFGAGRNCDDYTAPALNLEAHVAAVGMQFYTGAMFPAKYKNAIIMAQHGSWNRSKPIGYRLMAVTLEGNKVKSYEPFAEGWLTEGGKVKGRPADVLVMPDGSLLVSDDKADKVYRITYSKP